MAIIAALLPAFTTVRISPSRLPPLAATPVSVCAEAPVSLIRPVLTAMLLIVGVVDTSVPCLVEIAPVTSTFEPKLASPPLTVKVLVPAMVVPPVMVVVPVMPVVPVKLMPVPEVRPIAPAEPLPMLTAPVEVPVLMLVVLLAEALMLAVPLTLVVPVTVVVPVRPMEVPEVMDMAPALPLPMVTAPVLVPVFMLVALLAEALMDVMPVILVVPVRPMVLPDCRDMAPALPLPMVTVPVDVPVLMEVLLLDEAFSDTAPPVTVRPALPVNRLLNVLAPAQVWAPVETRPGLEVSAQDKVMVLELIWAPLAKDVQLVKVPTVVTPAPEPPFTSPITRQIVPWLS